MGSAVCVGLLPDVALPARGPETDGGSHEVSGAVCRCAPQAREGRPTLPLCWAIVDAASRSHRQAHCACASACDRGPRLIAPRPDTSPTPTDSLALRANHAPRCPRNIAKASYPPCHSGPAVPTHTTATTLTPLLSIPSWPSSLSVVCLALAPSLSASCSTHSQTRRHCYEVCRHRHSRCGLLRHRILSPRAWRGPCCAEGSPLGRISGEAIPGILGRPGHLLRRQQACASFSCFISGTLLTETNFRESRLAAEALRTIRAWLLPYLKALPGAVATGFISRAFTRVCMFRQSMR